MGTTSRTARAAPAAIARACLLIAGLAAAGWALRSLPLHDFAHRAAGLGLPGFVLIGALSCAIGLPRQAVAFAGGYAHGVWVGAALAMAAQLFGCLADLLWARLIAQHWVRARLRFCFAARLQGVLASHPFSATLMLRLLPAGNNLLLNLIAGAIGLRPGAFLLASAIGYIPQTAVFVLLGAGIHLARGTEIALALAAFVASVALGLALLRRARAQGAVA